MKTRTFTPMGSLHPVLFFAAVYIVALVFAIFICSALFYSCNTSPAKTAEGQNKTSSPAGIARSGEMVMR